MGIVFKNNAKTTLASSLSNSATSATVTDGSVFPSLSAGEFFLLTFDDGTNNEICKCTARSGNTLTIVRAQESTTARAFSSGDAAEGRVTAGVLETIQENIAAKSANQTVYNTTTASSATDYDIGIDPSVEANAMVFLNGVMQHHDTFSFSGSTLTFDAAPPNGMALEVIVDNLINLQSSNLTVDTFTATSGQTDFVLSDTPAAETNLIVFVDGVFQDQDSYTISNNTLTITDGVVLNRGVTVYVINPVNIGTPSDGTVTSAKLSGNITMPGTLTVGSNDVAFDSPTFVVDNANSRVGLGTASPSVPVDIVGDVKMSANLTVDTSTLVVDSTNNRVGIGTDNPDDALVVRGNIASPHRIAISNENASGKEALKFSQGTTTKSWIEFDNSTSTFDVWQYTSNPLRFGTSNTERMRIDSSGNLIMTAGGTIRAGGANDLILDAGESGTPDIYLQSGGATKVKIEGSNGNVGIGTTSPQTDLNIVNSSGATLDISTNLGAADAKILLHEGSSASPVNGASIRYDGANNLFKIGVGSSVDNTIITIPRDSGNVGIGTTSPSVNLEITESGSATNSVADVLRLNHITSGTAASGLGAGIVFASERPSGGINLTRGAIYGISGSDPDDDGALAFYTRTDTGGSGFSEKMRIDSSGNVGIGTTSPDISGFSKALTIDSSDSGIELASSGTIQAMFASNTQGATIHGVGSSGIRVFTSASGSTSERMRIDSSGNLLVGTSTLTPNYTGGIRVHSASSVGNIRVSAGAKTGFDMMADSGGTGYLVVRDNAGMTFHTNNTERMRIDSSGVVDITGGTLKLGSGSNRRLFYRSANNDILLESANGLFYRQDIGNTNHSWFTGNSEKMRIDSSGNLLVGTTSGGAHLVIGGNSNTARVLPATDNVGYIGESVHRWQAIYAVTGSIQTSDEREKTEIKETTLGLNFIKDLKPVSYKWIDGEQQNKGKDEREHQGLIAQQVAETVEKHGIDKNTFGGLDIQKTEKYDDFHGMSYDQFVAPLIKAIQEQQAQIETLKQEIREIREGG